MSTQARSNGSRPEQSAAKKSRGRPADATKRAAIVEAASEAFFDVGYAAASIEQIAADAGVSKVTIYNHFGDKRALFAAAVEHKCEMMRGHFSIASISTESTIREHLASIGRAMCAFLSRTEMVQFERRVAAETEHDPEIGRAFLEAGPWPMKRAFSTFLAHACEMGELDIVDAELATEQFVSMCKGMGDLERRFGSVPSQSETDRRINGAVDVFMAAYAPKK